MPHSPYRRLRSGAGSDDCWIEVDEISLLFGPEENGFGRKLRKLLSVLSGEASARFTLLLGAVAVFARPGQIGGYAVASSTGPGSAFIPGYQRRNTSRSSSFKTCVRT
jgi:hypothetical protein